MKSTGLSRGGIFVRQVYLVSHKPREHELASERCEVHQTLVPEWDVRCVLVIFAQCNDSYLRDETVGHEVYIGMGMAPVQDADCGQNQHSA